MASSISWMQRITTAMTHSGCWRKGTVMAGAEKRIGLLVVHICELLAGYISTMVSSLGI